MCSGMTYSPREPESWRKFTPTCSVTSVGFWLYSADCDAAFKRAVAAGATVKMPPADMFWGDRTGTVVDPFGYIWTFGTHVKDMTEAEMMRAGEEFAKSMRGGR